MTAFILRIAAVAYMILSAILFLVALDRVGKGSDIAEILKVGIPGVVFGVIACVLVGRISQLSSQPLSDQRLL